MAGPHYFEVAWNHVYNCKKEGIDVKETAAFGKVHHNYVHDCARQGLYIDSWFGLLENIEMYQNVVFNCEAGIAVSSEEGPAAQNLKIHHNLVYNNRATGLFFSRWGADNFRENVQIYNNTFYKNGWGANFSKDPKYWLSGGCYLFTTNLKNVVITNNIFAQNFPFEIGFSSEYGSKIPEEQNIIISYNLIQDINTWEWPFYMETWAKDSVFPTTGLNSILADPLFENPGLGDFRLKLTSNAIQAGNPILEYAGKNGAPDDLGAFPSITLPEHFWWLTNFPPKIEPDTF